MFYEFMSIGAKLQKGWAKKRITIELFSKLNIFEHG